MGRPILSPGKKLTGGKFGPVTPGWFKICVLVLLREHPKATESGFMEKPGIEPAIPGLQDIGLSPTPRRLLDKPFLNGTCHLNQIYTPAKYN